MTPIDVFALPATPWKNGGGATRTIATFPANAGFDNFHWRISIADVGASGDFSRFPGIDRTILLLEGAGMTLHTNNSKIASLTKPYEPFHFSGDDQVTSELVAGTSRDFNVMTHRGHAEATVTVSTTTFQADASNAAVFFCPRGAYKVESGDTLAAGFAILADKPELTLVPQTPDAVLIAVQIKLLENS